MNNARYWPGSRLLLTCLALLGALASFRWFVAAGTYQATIENHRVLTTDGLWSPAFASIVVLIGTGAFVLTIVWTIATWFVGRHDRQARHQAETAGHRKVLI